MRREVAETDSTVALWVAPEIIVARSSRAFAAGLDRFGTRLIDAACDQESLSGDPAEELRQAALPAHEPGSPRLPEVDRLVSTAELGACPTRSPPAA